MSPSGEHLRRGKALLGLLRTVHPLFVRSLSTADELRQDRYGRMSEADFADLSNGLTILRIDVKSLPYILEQIDIDQLTRATDVDRLVEALDLLLSLLEDSVLVPAEFTSQIKTAEVRTFVHYTVSRRHLQD